MAHIYGGVFAEISTYAIRVRPHSQNFSDCKTMPNKSRQACRYGKDEFDYGKDELKILENGKDE